MRYFSMFSGIGGFEYGIQQSNIPMECVGFCEVDKYAISIYSRHFPKHKNWGDATKIKTEDLPDFDFLVGGFPCQAFSHAGKRRGFDDTRGTLFFEIARVLKDKRPRYFLLENVRGLLSHDQGKTFQTILEILSNLGYIVQWTLLNSADFQVPQRRERVFIEGYIRGECTGEILSVRRNCSKTDGSVSNKYYNGRYERIHKTDELMNTLTCNGQNDGSRQLLIEKKERATKCINPNAAQAQQIYEIDGLSTTLCANGGGQGGKTGLYRIPKK